MSAREDFLALEQIRRDTISVPRAYIDIAGGDIASGVMLAQLLYWFGDAADGTKRTRIVKDGRDWIARKWDEWHRECRLTPDQARRCVEVLSRLGLVEKDIWRFDGSPTVHLSLNFEAIMASHKKIVGGLVAQMDLVKTPDPSGEKPSSIPGNRPEPLTETTSETTTEKKRRAKPALPSLPAEIDTPAVRTAWEEFVQMRKEKKKEVTPQVAKNLFKNLGAWGPRLAEIALRKSVCNSWTGAFKPKPEEVDEFVQSAPAPKPDPAAEAEADRQQAMARARYAYDGAALKLCPGSDGWGLSSRTWLFDGLEALQSPEDFDARLDHARSLVARLRSLGAFPLVGKKADPGLIFPACGGGPWRPFLVDCSGAGIEGIRPAREMALQAEATALTRAMVGPGPGIDKAGAALWSIDDSFADSTPPALPHIDCNASPPSERIAEAYERHMLPPKEVSAIVAGELGEESPPEKVEEVYDRHVHGWPLRHDTGFDETYSDDGSDGYDMVGDDLTPEQLRDEWPIYEVFDKLVDPPLDADDWDDEGTHICGDRSEP